MRTLVAESERVLRSGRRLSGRSVAVGWAPAAVPIDVPEDERLVGQVARSHERARVCLAKQILELRGVMDAGREETPDVGGKGRIVAGVQVCCRRQIRLGDHVAQA
jgi:hypothetical protein